jgi:Outer membrane protein beta-barrel domain
MRFSRAVVLCVLLASLGQTTTAFAQEKGALGVVMGYPTSIGLIYHVSDRFALRPEVTFAVVGTESDTDFSSSEGDTWSLGFAISGNFYVGQWDKLRSYVNARYSYSHAETTTSTTLLPPLSENNEATLTSNAHGFFGMFGAEYSLHDRFSVFGEVGLGYTRQRSESEATGGKSTGHQFGPRTAVGVTFYF